MLSNFSKTDLQKPNPYLNQHPKINLREAFDFKKTKQYQKLICEVGCGRGDWVIDQAKKNPNNYYLAIERTISRSLQLLTSANKAQNPNLYAIQANAIYFLADFLPNNSIDELFFFYPNPWPKKKQANKRFFTSSGFYVFDAKLKKGGKITITSNILGYIEEAHDFLEKIWGYQSKFWLVNPTKAGRTAFEVKYAQQKYSLWQLEAKRS